MLEGQAAVGGGGDAPVDQVDVEAAGQVLPDDALVGLQVEDVGPVDQRVAEQDRLGVRRPASRAGSAAAGASPPRRRPRRGVVPTASRGPARATRGTLKQSRRTGPRGLVAGAPLPLQQSRSSIALAMSNATSAVAAGLALAAPPLAGSPAAPLHRHAAVDVEHVPGDEAGRRRGQVEDARRAISIGSPRRPDRRDRERPTPAPCRGSPSIMRVLMKPGATALTVTPLRAYLAGQRLGQPDQPGLGGGVVRLAEVADLADDARDVDDPAPAALGHRVDELLGDHEDAGRGWC